MEWGALLLRWVHIIAGIAWIGSSFYFMHLDAALAGIPSGSSSVYLHVTGLVPLIDHTAAGTLLEFVENFRRAGRGLIQIVGLDQLEGRSRDESCLRVCEPVLAQERAAALAELARLSMTGASRVTVDSVVFLERISLTRVGPVPGRDDRAIAAALLHARRYLVRKIRAATTFVRTLGIGDEVEVLADTRDLGRLSLSWKEKVDFSSDAEWLCLSQPARRSPTAVSGDPSWGNRWL